MSTYCSKSPAALPNAKATRIAGSETTSVVLSTTVFYLSRTPDCARNLREELDAAFTDSSQINAASTARLEYLTAVCKEAMRIFPPAPFMQYRIVPKPGDTIDGNYVPGGVSQAQPVSTSLKLIPRRPSYLPPSLALHAARSTSTSPSTSFQRDGSGKAVKTTSQSPIRFCLDQGHV